MGDSVAEKPRRKSIGPRAQEGAEDEGAGPALPAAGASGEADRVKDPVPTPRKRTKRDTASRARTRRKEAPRPEVLARDDSAADGPSEGSDVVVDVGNTVASLPVPVSRASVPAVRSRAGVQRARALERFLSEMGRYPLLTLEEERELTAKVHRDRDPIAARKLVVHNLRLVVKMAYKYRRTWANVLDLIQEGNVGLLEAVRRYDPLKGARFSTYATFWIRAYILRYLLEHSRMVRISRTRVGRKLFFRLSREREKLRAQGIEPGPKLLAEKLNVDAAELDEVVKHMDQPEVWLDAPVGLEEGGGTVLDGMSAPGQSPEAEAFRKAFADDVSTALESFGSKLTDEREKEAWAKHLLAEDPESLSSLGKRFGVTKQRMGQIVSGLRKRLKVHLLDTLGPDVELGFHFDAD